LEWREKTAGGSIAGPYTEEKAQENPRRWGHRPQGLLTCGLGLYKAPARKGRGGGPRGTNTWGGKKGHIREQSWPPKSLTGDDGGERLQEEELGGHCRKKEACSSDFSRKRELAGNVEKRIWT